MRCLWLAGECPDSADSGLFLYSRGASEALARAGAEVVGIGLDRRVPPSPGAVRWQRIPARRRRAERSVLSRLPAMAYAFATGEYRTALADRLRHPWDVVVIDHLQMGWAVPEVRRHAPAVPIVYASQNHETTVRREVARAAPLRRRAALDADARKVQRLERTVVQASSVVTAITDDDAACFRRDVRQSTRVLTLPPGYDGEVVEHRSIDTSTPRRAIVLGSFEWHVKEANLREFLTVADPLFADANAQIRVVGSVRDEFRREMELHLRASTFAGHVPSITDELARARIGIVAETLGGGFKMKALDYAFHRVPVAMIEGSANGLPLRAGKSLLEFPDITALAAGALDVLDDTRTLTSIADMAFTEVHEQFDWSARGRALLNALERAADG